jgi:hypothetical protein
MALNKPNLQNVLMAQAGDYTYLWFPEYVISALLSSYTYHLLK